MQWRVAARMRSKISASPRTSSCAVGSSSSTTPAPSSHGAERARQRDALPLPAGEVGAAVVAAGQHRVEAGERARRRPPSSAAWTTSSGAPRGATLSRSGSSKRMKSWKTAVTRARHDVERRARAGRCRRPRWRRPAGRTAGTAAWRASSCRRRSGRRWPATSRRGSSDRSPRAPARRRRGIGERDVAEADLARRQAGGRPRARRAARPAGAIAGSRRSTAATGAAAPSSAQLSPPNAIIDVPTARLREHDDLAERRGGRRRRRSRATRTRRTLAADDEQQAPQHRLLAQPRRLVLQRVQPRPARRRSGRSSSRPGRTGAAPWPAADRRRAGRRSRRRAARRAPRRCCGRARRRSRAAASASRARRRRARAAPTTRKPNSTTAAREPADHLDQAAGDEVHRDRQRRAGHPEIEVARHGEVARERRILEVAHARRAHARLGQPVVQPGGGAVAEVGADRLMNRRQDLEQDEHGAGEGERAAQAVAASHGADEHAHRDREDRRQHAAQDEHDPPRDRQGAIGPRQDAEELPLLAFGQISDHGPRVSQTLGGCVL